jgi:thymidylate synthase
MNYLEIIKNVVNNGTLKQATRLDDKGNPIPVENGTIGTFCEIFRHDMSTGFPLTTLRKMPWQSIRVELEGFIKGITDKLWYKERKCNFWSEWANPEVVKEKWQDSVVADEDRDSFTAKIDLRKKIQAETNDLGPIYGYQWRSFNKTYKTQSEDDGDFHNYTDQLKSIVDKLKSTPYDRRMVCSAWNPNQMHMMALPPCHWGFNVVVYGDKLNLIWHQRSCDLLLGVCSNIASYALLLELLAKEANLVPGELVGTLADCHIYENHMDAARELIKREEKELPKLKIVTPQGLDLQANRTERKFSIFDWEWRDAVLTGYNPHDKINVGSVTV